MNLLKLLDRRVSWAVLSQVTGRPKESLRRAAESQRHCAGVDYLIGLMHGMTDAQVVRLVRLMQRKIRRNNEKVHRKDQ